MSKKYSLTKVAEVFLNDNRRKSWSLFARGQIAQRVVVLAAPDNRCYTYYDYYNGLTIMLGKTFYKDVFNLSDEVEPLDLKTSVYSHLAKIYIGAFYHEFFHLKYTDMDYEKDLLRKLDNKIASLVHIIFNILEDVTIENSGVQDYPSSRHFIDKLSEIHFQEGAIESASNLIKDHPKTVDAFISFLLLYARGYGVSKLPEYEFFEDNKELIEWGISQCIYERFPRSRHKKQIAFAIQLLKLLKGEEFDKKKVTNSEIEEGVTVVPRSGTGDMSRVVKGVTNMDGGMYESTRNEPIEAQEYDPTATSNMNNVEGKEERKQSKASRGDMSMEDIDPTAMSSDLTQQGIETIANDDPVTHYTHLVERLDDYVDTSKYVPSYRDVKKKFSKLINSVTGTIRKMKAHNVSSYRRNQSRGVIDIKAVINNKPINKSFMRVLNPGREPDPVFSVVVDNSGSMSGRKATLAGEACIALSESLNNLGISFGVFAFTEGRGCVTIVLKDYKDIYDKVKYNLTLFTNNIHCAECATYMGNIDEVNIRYLRDQLSHQPHSDKIMIVISDGATCGDWKELKRVADDMERRGIRVLGIGIYDNNVEKIYKNHIILREQKDLEALPAFLNQYLIKMYNGGK
ncbi:MAG: VWA domain-containing protein [Paludibacteraceae bacterium]|nr:VWA domain-containing protein [Paludibacteraceae bacterium]